MASWRTTMPGSWTCNDSGGRVHVRVDKVTLCDLDACKGADDDRMLAARAGIAEVAELLAPADTRALCCLMAVCIHRPVKIAVVTGANRGIGLEVCRQLAGNGVTVVLTAMDEEIGVEAVENLKGRALADVLFHQLDITDVSSIVRLASFLKTRFGKLDILVNNAAVGGVVYSQDPFDDLETREEKFNLMDRDQRLEWLWRNCRETYEAAKEALQTNHYGTKHVIEALLPLLKASDDGRIVNVSSDFGLLRHFRNEELKQELNDVGKLTEERLDELLGQFLRDFNAGAAEARGWPVAFAAYKVGKAAVNAYTRMLAAKQPALRVNCVHPGYVKSDITLHSGLLTPQEGASNVVKVALLPCGAVTGAFFEEGRELASFV